VNGAIPRKDMFSADTLYHTAVQTYSRVYPNYSEDTIILIPRETDFLEARTRSMIKLRVGNITIVGTVILQITQGSTYRTLIMWSEYTCTYFRRSVNNDFRARAHVFVISFTPYIPIQLFLWAV
jgi:hypothetical protein